ncbi:MAG: hypothetical protein M1830_004709 [Pleopsidium flavum]|nr:MAG: hypothetical protein M1830_004709 [Pleopsidium flavum]
MTLVLLLCYSLSLQALFIGNLNIARDKIDRMTSYTVVATFDVDVADPKVLSDKQLNGFALKAHAEMLTLVAKENVKRPSVMSALVVRKKIYFASSLKGDREYVYKEGIAPDQVVQALNECQQNGQIHRTGGGCGEVNVVTLYYDTEGRNADLRNERARIIAVGVPSRHDEKPAENKAPCSEPGKWGCLEFCRNLGLSFVQGLGRSKDDSSLSFKSEQPRLKCDAPS